MESVRGETCSGWPRLLVAGLVVIVVVFGLGVIGLTIARAPSARIAQDIDALARHLSICGIQLLFRSTISDW